MLLAMLTPEAVGPAPPGLYEGTVLEAQRYVSVGGTWLGGYQLCFPPPPQPILSLGFWGVTSLGDAGWGRSEVLLIRKSRWWTLKLAMWATAWHPPD